MKKYKKIYIEITNKCNLSCSFCQISNRDIRFMSFDDFNLILNQIKKYTDYIYLHVKGEPLLHPQIIDFIKLTSDFGLKVNITTNGTLLKNHFELLNHKNIRQINLSLHSLNELSENLKNETLSSIISFIKEGLLTSNIIFALRFWNLENTNHSLSKLNDKIIEELINKFDINSSLSINILSLKNTKIKDRLFIHFDTLFEWPSLLNNYSNNKGFCYGLRDQIGILSDGTVVPCCLDGEGVIKLGNIFSDNIDEIINGNLAKDIFNGFSDNKAIHDLCIHCSFKEKIK